MRIAIVTLLGTGFLGAQIALQAAWHDQEPTIDIRLPGHEPVTLARSASSVILTRKEIPA